MFKSYPFNPNCFKFDKVGINVSFSFKGFCQSHDTSIFKPIENYEIDFEDYNSQLLFAYRTLLNEKRKKEICLDWYKKQKNDSILSNIFHLELINKAIEQAELAIKDGDYYENIMTSNLNSDKKDFIFKVRYINKVDICLASYFPYETSRKIREHFIKTGKNLDLLTNIFISFFPIEGDGESVLIMGYLKSKEGICGSFVEDFFTVDEASLLSKISKLMMRQCEQWACSNKFYENHIKERETEIINILKETANSLDEDKEVCFNLFD